MHKKLFTTEDTEMHRGIKDNPERASLLCVLCGSILFGSNCPEAE